MSETAHHYDPDHHSSFSNYLDSDASNLKETGKTGLFLFLFQPNVLKYGCSPPTTGAQHIAYIWVPYAAILHDDQEGGPLMLPV